MARGSRSDGEASFWRRMVRDQAASGLTIRAWCRRHDVAELAFHWWRTQLTRRGGKSNAAFVPVHVTAEEDLDSQGRIEIVLGDGRRIRLQGGVDRTMLADVLAVLEGTDEAEGRSC